jgi:glycosyltransferase involved in cell wall biosynthesis
MLKVTIDAQLPEHTLYRYMRSGQPKKFEWLPKHDDGHADVTILALENSRSQERIANYVMAGRPFLLYMESTFWLTDYCDAKFVSNIDRQPACLGVCSHTKKTLDEFATLLPSKPRFHVPVGVPRQDFLYKTGPAFLITFLFWGSHNDREQKAWKDRGGQLVCDLFIRLHTKFHCKLILRAPKDADLISKAVWPDDVEMHHDYLSDAELDDIHRRSDVLLLPSSKAHFISVPYAASFGIPTVGLEHWALRELIEDGVNGIIARDFDDLVERCSRLPEQLPALSRGALERQRRDHDCESYPERWAKVFKELGL